VIITILCKHYTNVLVLCKDGINHFIEWRHWLTDETYLTLSKIIVREEETTAYMKVFEGAEYIQGQVQSWYTRAAEVPER
jgi:hypothetical protein